MWTIDKFLDGRVSAKQPARGYRSASDAVLLAAAVPAKPRQAVLELGCGAGVVLACLAVRVEELKLAGIDFQEGMAALAKENLPQAEILCADIVTCKHAPWIGKFDQVCFNPPYFSEEAHSAIKGEQKKMSKTMAQAQLPFWVKAAQRFLKPKGWMTAILPIELLPAFLGLLKGFGAVELVPLWPKSDLPAKRFILRAQKGAKTPFKLRQGLVLHMPDGGHTAIAKAILRNAKALDEAIAITR